MMENPMLQWVRNDYQIVSPFTDVNSIRADLLQKGALVVVNDKTGQFIGIITPKDALAHPHNLVSDCIREKPFIKINAKPILALRDMINSQETVLPLGSKEDFRGLLFLNDMVQHIYSTSMQQIRRLVRSKQKVSETDKVLGALYNSTDSVRFLIDPTGKILFFNKKANQNAVALFGREIKLGDILLNYALEVLNKDENSFEEDFTLALGGEFITREREIIHEQKSYWFRTEFYPVYIDSKLMGIAINTRDITAKKDAFNYIERQNLALKDIMVFQSHQVRRPVANILGLVQIMDKSAMSEQNAYMLEKLNEAALQLDEIIHSVVEKASFWVRESNEDQQLLR